MGADEFVKGNALHALYPPVAGADRVSARVGSFNDGTPAVMLSLHSMDGACMSWIACPGEQLIDLIERCMAGEVDPPST